jgi:hypothetical protein
VKELRDREALTLDDAARLFGEEVERTRERLSTGEVRVIRRVRDGAGWRLLVSRADVYALIDEQSSVWVTPKLAARLLGITPSGAWMLARLGVVRSTRLHRGALAQKRGRPIHSARVLLDRMDVQERARQQQMARLRSKRRRR